MSGVNLNPETESDGLIEPSKSSLTPESCNAPNYGRKLARWVDDLQEVYVRENTDLEYGKQFTVEYREGRFGATHDHSGEEAEGLFNNIEDALEKGEEMAESHNIL